MGMAAGERWGRRYRWWLAAALPAVPLVALIAVVGPAGSYRLLFQDNLMQVIPGAVYRSGQPSSEDLEDWMDRYGFRSVVNLRGHTNERSWYRAERDIVGRYGAEHFTVRISAQRLPGAHELRDLIRVVDQAPRPLLLHCQGGVERTGLAAAVAVLLHEHGDLDQARGQFAPETGLVPGLHSRRSLFDPWLRSDLLLVLDQYAAWLSENGLSHAPHAFRRWAQAAYVPYFYRAELSVPGQDAVVRAGTTLQVAITNTSPEVIPFRAQAMPGVRLGAKLAPVGPRGPNRGAPEPAVPRELRGALVDRDLAPGDTLTLPLVIPELPIGRYRLVVDLVNEGERWFGQMGSPPLELVLVSGAAVSSTGHR